jgi:hypothetical protein
LLSAFEQMLYDLSNRSDSTWVGSPIDWKISNEEGVEAARLWPFAVVGVYPGCAGDRSAGVDFTCR